MEQVVELAREHQKKLTKLAEFPVLWAFVRVFEFDQVGEVDQLRSSRRISAWYTSLNLHENIKKKLTKLAEFPVLQAFVRVFEFDQVGKVDRLRSSCVVSAWNKLLNSHEDIEKS